MPVQAAHCTGVRGTVWNHFPPYCTITTCSHSGQSANVTSIALSLLLVDAVLRCIDAVAVRTVMPSLKQTQHLETPRRLHDATHALPVSH